MVVFQGSIFQVKRAARLKSWEFDKAQKIWGTASQ